MMGLLWSLTVTLFFLYSIARYGKHLKLEEEKKETGE